MGPTHTNGRKRLVSDINVTPLVDVMLVLLIIFMITAPMMTQGVNVDLPETTAKSLRQEEKPLVISLKKDGSIHLNSTPVTDKLLRQELATQFSINPKQPIYLRADRDVAYGQVVTIMAAIKEIGFDKIGMVTKPPVKR